MHVISQNDFLYLGILICLYKSRIIFLYNFNKDRVFSYYDLKHEFMKLVFNVYIVGVISKVYFPLTIAWEEYVNYRGPVIILNPIESIIMIYNKGGIDEFIYNILGNLILLAPMGFFLYYYYRERIKSFKTAILTSFCISLFIECSQVILSLVFPNVCRYFEVNDLMLNALGGGLGYLLTKLLVELRERVIVSSVLSE